jgi:1-acyl-sn-glycerol-3-phosphate acyltransferase
MPEAIIRPPPEVLARLSPFERVSFRLADFVNSNRLAKAGSSLFLRSAGMTWVYYCTRNLVHILGLDHVRRLRLPGGLVLASNHRSFFDQYVIACWLFRTTTLLERLYFPVRAEFWYQKPSGVALSLVMSGFCMYPPVFREEGKREFNRYGVKRLAQILEEPGSVVGIHPEGTRNKGDDPYTLLPAKPGVGKLILAARPTVLPIFINGLGNDFGPQVKSNFNGGGRPIVIVLGEPLDLEAYYAKPNNLRTQKELADHVLDRIAALGPLERDYRRAVELHPVRGPVAK